MLKSVDLMVELNIDLGQVVVVVLQHHLGVNHLGVAEEVRSHKQTYNLFLVLFSLLGSTHKKNA